MKIKEVKNIVEISAFYGDFATFTTEANGEKRDGLINRQGDVVIPAEKYRMILPDNVDENLFLLYLEVEEGHITLHSFYDAKLGMLVPQPKREKPQRPELPDFARKYEEAYCVTPNRIIFKEGDFYGLMDENGKVIVPPTYTDAQKWFTSKDRISVEKDDKVSYINLDGKLLLPFEYPFVSYNKKYGYYSFRTHENKWGHMDESGKIIIPAVYNYICVGTRGLDEMSVKKDGRFYFINARQEEVKVF